MKTGVLGCLILILGLPLQAINAVHVPFANKKYTEASWWEMFLFQQAQHDAYDLELSKVRYDDYAQAACTLNKTEIEPQTSEWLIRHACDCFEVVTMSSCARWIASEQHLSHCAESLRADMTSLDSLYCVIVLTVRELSLREVISLYKVAGCEEIRLKSSADVIKHCSRPGPGQDPPFYAAARRLIVKYRLTEVENKTWPCLAFSKDNVEASYSNLDLDLSVWKPFFRAYLLHPGFRRHYGHPFVQFPPLSDICWLPSLQQPNVLYHKQGRWKVNKNCVTLLQTIATRMFYFSSEHLVKLARNFSLFNASIPREHLWSQYTLPVLIDKYQLFFFELAFEKIEMVCQLFLYPMFRRFETTALQRGQTGDMTSSAVVSCDGLQGTRDQVVANSIELLRLVIVNEFHFHDESVLIRSYFLPFADHVLDCLIEDFI